MLRSHDWIFPMVLVALMLTATVLARKQETGFLNRALTFRGNLNRYQVYVPPDWDKKKKWPVILFLHGAGERGDDGLIQTEVGIGTAIRRHAERFPCIVVFPQCRKDIWWLAPDMESLALKTLDKAMKEFKGDPQKTYLTGISMGGYGTWDIASKNSGRFAALVPICGGIRLPLSIRNQPGVPSDVSENTYSDVAKKIGSTPVWIFHGSADAAVPVTESRRIVEALKTAGGNVRYTEYEGVGHNSWDRAYGEAELMPWLLGHSLRGSK